MFELIFNLMFLSIVLQIVSFFIGGWIGLETFKKNPNIDFDQAYKESKPLIIISITLLILFSLGSLFTRFDDLLEILPLVLQRVAIVYCWTMMAIFISLMSGFAIFLAYKLKKNFRTYLPSLVVLNILYMMLHFQTNNDVGDIITKSEKKNGGFLQTTGYTCTSASVATVALKLGIDTTEKEVAILSRLTKFGANSGQIRYALNKLGINYETLNGKYKKLEDVKPPAIIYVNYPTIGKDGHAIVYLGVKNGGYKIWDPLKGKSFMSYQDIKKDWNGNGIRCFREINK